MSADIIVSYDGTPNDDDALALGEALAATGASLALAYVRHSLEFDPSREVLAQHDAARRLEFGAQVLGDDVATHVVLSASTGGGLEQLARSEGASMIVFGSDYRTPPGRAEPGNTAQKLLEGGPVAIAIAAAGLRTRLGAPISSIAVGAYGETDTALETAEAIAARLDAEIVSNNGHPVDLIVVASQSAAPSGRIALGGATRAELNTFRGSVLVVPRGAPVLTC